MVGRALTDLMMAGHAATLEELPRMVADHAAAVGLNNVAFFLVDLQGRVLRQVTGRGLDAGAGGGEPAVDATVAGLAFQRVDLVADITASAGSPPSTPTTTAHAPHTAGAPGTIPPNRPTDHTSGYQTVAESEICGR